MGSTSSVSMLPRPSRLKSLASELSPVFTTPPPVEPNTVFVLMSVPEMMLSSNLVVLRRRAANSATSAAISTTMPPMNAQLGVLLMNSSKNPGASFGGALAAGLGGGVVAFGVSTTFGGSVTAGFGGSAALGGSVAAGLGGS